jgi:hypothetical protein
MAEQKKDEVDVRDLKPNKDAKGGRGSLAQGGGGRAAQGGGGRAAQGGGGHAAQGGGGTRNAR